MGTETVNTRTLRARAFVPGQGNRGDDILALCDAVDRLTASHDRVRALLVTFNNSPIYPETLRRALDGPPCE